MCQKYDQRISASAVASSSWDSEVPYKIFESPLPGSVCSEPKIRFSSHHYIIFHDCCVTFGLEIYMGCIVQVGNGIELEAVGL